MNLAHEDLNGWHKAPAGTHWACPECETVTPIKRWGACVISDGPHTNEDARRCPNCGGEVPAEFSEAVARVTEDELPGYLYQAGAV